MLYNVIINKTEHSICMLYKSEAENTRCDSIVDVSRLLGHRRLDTTMEYITTNSDSVKSNHRNCVI